MTKNRRRYLSREKNGVTDVLDKCVKLFLKEHRDSNLLRHDVQAFRRAADTLESAALARRKSFKSASDSARQYVQERIPAGFYRGGTSRAIIFNKKHLPEDKEECSDAFQQHIGSKQICLVEVAPAESEADILYTLVGVGIEGNEVGLNGNWGAMAAAIGPYAYNEDMALPMKSSGKRVSGTCSDQAVLQPFGVTYNILNTNTNVMIRSSFLAIGNQAYVDDSVSIDGVTGYGTGVTLDFLRPGGSKTGKLLPTGKPVDIINGINVSCVDATIPCVFVKASDLDIEPTILPTQFLARPADLQRLEDIRSQAAILMGLCKTGDTPPRFIPKIGILSPPVEQQILSKEINPADTLDLVVRFVSDGRPHRVIPLTAALCTAAAAKVPGSIVQQCVREASVNEGFITIGHPSGRIQVNATMDGEGDVECCTVVRTARRIMSGHIYYTPKPIS
ncbi:hypothetical protein FKW77_002533 [Venturia effusa]|uniref:Uncharacterized protein n=1 Tax=Venturia effusa TaxID=50376 RepID=A0A517LDE1_9PEZI|nr:hypothetical protein FKW77_002533 [Venturia effusa]